MAEFIGTVHTVLEAQSGVSQKGTNWMSQDFVVQSEGQYPKFACFKLFGEQRVGNAAKFLVPGTLVKVSYDINAREYNGRWYNSLEAWKVEDGNDVAAAPAAGFQGGAPASVAQAAPSVPKTPPAAVAPPPASAIPAPQSNPDGDDLPF